jgi:hypothetical protein
MFDSDTALRERLLSRISEMSLLTLESLAVSAVAQQSSNRSRGGGATSAGSAAANRWTNVFRKIKKKL